MSTETVMCWVCRTQQPRTLTTICEICGRDFCDRCASREDHTVCKPCAEDATGDKREDF